MQFIGTDLGVDQDQNEDCCLVKFVDDLGYMFTLEINTIM